MTPAEQAFLDGEPLLLKAHPIGNSAFIEVYPHPEPSLKSRMQDLRDFAHNPDSSYKTGSIQPRVKRRLA